MTDACLVAMRRALALAATSAVWCALSATASAQSFPASISGTIRDSLGVPVFGVELLERESGRRYRTDSTGRYSLRGLDAGPAYVEVRRLGFRGMAIDTTLRPAERLVVDLVLAAAPTRISGVTVNENGAVVTRLMLDFERRRRAGAGVFVTRQQIDDRDPQYLTDMFRTVPGVSVRGTGVGGYALRIARNGNCRPHYYVDGHFQPEFELDLIQPADIEGIELYRGSSETPPQFNRFNAICGAVVIWTRDPGAG